jgi:hypothetical protein
MPRIMARPPKPLEKRRNRILQVRLSAEEEAILKGRVPEDLSTWAREVLLRAAKRRSSRQKASE